MISETKSVSFPPDGHPEESHLLLALECELSPEELSRIEQHLGSCWSCRARSEEIQRGILAFVEYRENRYLPTLLSPPNDYTNFRGRLQHVAGESRHIRWSLKSWRRIFDLFSWPRNLKWASVVAVAMVMVVFWAEVLNPPVVSANEFLTRAIAAQNAHVDSNSGGTRLRVAHQTVRIGSGGQSVVRTFEWTVGRPIPQTRWSLQPDPLKWNAPLTAEGFAEWRDTLLDKKDKVKHSGDLLTLETFAAHDSIKEAWIVVRAGDFHPLEQHLRYADDRQLDLIETAFEIRDQAQPAFQSSSQMPSATTSHSAFPKIPPSQTGLDETELQLRYILFLHGWDLGEDLTITRIAGHVVVSGTVSSAERERAMRATLNSLPGVRLALRVPSGFQSLPSEAKTAKSGNGQTVPPSPLLKDALERSFAFRAERLGFVDASLASSDKALSHAWALRKLADRYTPAEERRLDPKSDIKLREMLRSHLQELSRANAGLQPLLQLLPPLNVQAPAPPPSWREGIRLLFIQSQQQDELVANLVVGTQANGQGLAEAAAKMRTIHESIQAVGQVVLKELSAKEP